MPSEIGANIEFQTMEYSVDLEAENLENQGIARDWRNEKGPFATDLPP